MKIEILPSNFQRDNDQLGSISNLTFNDILGIYHGGLALSWVRQLVIPGVRMFTRPERE